MLLSELCSILLVPDRFLYLGVGLKSWFCSRGSLKASAIFCSSFSRIPACSGDFNESDVRRLWFCGNTCFSCTGFGTLLPNFSFLVDLVDLLELELELFDVSGLVTCSSFRVGLQVCSIFAWVDYWHDGLDFPVFIRFLFCEYCIVPCCVL